MQTNKTQIDFDSEALVARVEGFAAGREGARERTVELPIGHESHKKAVAITAQIHDCAAESEPGFAATCVEFPEANGHGATVEDCVKNLCEAVSDVMAARTDRVGHVNHAHGKAQTTDFSTSSRHIFGERMFNSDLMEDEREGYKS